MNGQDPIDWGRVEQLARAACLADHTVIDLNDFEAGYKGRGEGALLADFPGR